jgi:hypothetical protein
MYGRLLLVAVLVVALPAGTATATGGTGREAPALAAGQVDCGPGTPAMPESRDAFFGTLAGLNGTDAFEAYTEFELVRSQSLLEVQVGDFDRSKRQRTERTVELLWTFRRAYACREAGEFDAALSTANESAEIAAALRESGGGQLGVLADLALTRFYRSLGSELLNRAERLERTPDRIEALQQAAIAFRRGEATERFSRVSVRLDRVRRTYRADMAVYNESVGTATAFLEGCRDCTAPLGALRTHREGTFDVFLEARAVSGETAVARETAATHNLDERVQRADSLGSSLSAVVRALGLAAGGVMVGATVVLGLFAAVVAGRLAAWRRDVEASRLGDVVLVGEMLDG